MNVNLDDIERRSRELPAAAGAAPAAPCKAAKLDRYRVQSKLGRNERIAWIGRPVPSFRFEGCRFLLCFGVVWWIPTGLALFRLVLPMWFGANGGAATPAALSFGDRLFPTLLVGAFAVIGVILLLSPLLHWLSQRAQLYAVTDARALFIGRPFSFSYPASELRQHPLRRESGENGLTNLFFVTRIVYEPGPSPKFGRPRWKEVPVGFLNLLPGDADAAERALRELKRHPPTRNDSPDDSPFH